MTITAADFPTPDLALRTHDADELARVRAFAGEQARAATAALPALVTGLRTARSRRARVNAMTNVYWSLVRWRADLARRGTEQLGTGLPHDARRFAMPLRDGGPNYDRIGYVGRLREDSVWDPVTRTYRGGRVTPAHRVVLHYGAVATRRFATEEHDGDTLWNRVTLPDGTTIVGNSLVRGAAARLVAADLLARIASRGEDPTRVETGGDPMYVVTAGDQSRARMFHHAMTVLADTKAGDACAWRSARYLLYQAPMTKRGSDSVTRVFLVAVGTVLLGHPPALEQDVDLRCIVSGQVANLT